MVLQKQEQTIPNDDFSTPTDLCAKKRKRSSRPATLTQAKCSKRWTPTKGQSSRVRKLVPAREATFVLNEKGGQDDIATETDEDSSETNDTPRFSIKYVDDLEYSIQDMTTKYKRSCESLKEKAAKIKEERLKRWSLEGQQRRVTFDMDIEREKTNRLEEEIADLTQVRSALEEECKKRAREETILRLYAAEKEDEIDKMHEEKILDLVSFKEGYEECTKRVLELENELDDANVRLLISEDQTNMIVREKEEKISELQAANGKLEVELKEARRTVDCLENASKESSRYENFGPKENECDLLFMETVDSGAFILQGKNLVISRRNTENLLKNNQISDNEVESPSRQSQTESLGSSEEVPIEISSSTEETNPILDQISKLRPPPQRSPGASLPPGLLEQSMDLVPRVKSFLVSQLTSTNTPPDLNTMIDLANNAFSTLDWCLADYSSFHCDVRDFIRCHSERLEAEEERNGDVYAQIRSRHEELLNRSIDAEEALSNAEGELMSAIEKLEPLRNEIVKARELLAELKKEMGDREVEIEDLKEERDGCADTFATAEDEAQKMDWRRWEIDQRVEKAMEGDERMRDRLRSHIC